MKVTRLLPVIGLAISVACSPTAEEGYHGSGDNNGTFHCRDYDEDTICDEDEGYDTLRDSDGDGIPDYQDTDSDNDGITDAIEAGDDDPSTPPRDSDNDGTPDYLDKDSDGNGIPDAEEGMADIDGDGVPNFQDTDNDGDLIPDDIEIGGDPSNPRNSDADSENPDLIPDYNDTDSDGDGIGDYYEGMSDPDGDGIPNYLDTDSDGDGIPDSREAHNDGLVDNPPVDSDGDGAADAYDVDSDNDGLRDDLEDANQNGIVDPGESDPTKEDTDGDGVSDMIEHAAGTDPNDPGDSPRTRGDFVFIEPYQEPPDPTEDVLDFSTSFKSLDLMFVEDLSGSMLEEIRDVSDELSNLLAALVCDPGEDPDTTGCIPSVESGVEVFGGAYSQNGVSKQCDGTFCLIKPVSADNAATQAYLPTEADYYGGDERAVGAVWDTTQGSCSTGAPNRLGKACWREDALKVALVFTDETLDGRNDGGYYNASHFDDIANAGVGVVLIYSSQGDSDVASDGVNMVTSSGQHLIPTLDPVALSSIPECQGLSNFYQQGGTTYAALDGYGSNAGDAMICAVKAVSAYMPQDVEALVLDATDNVDASGNHVNAPEAFIDHIEVFMTGDATCPSGYNTTDSNGDGADDKFVGILPGSRVCWKIFSKQNDTVQPAEEPQMFRAIVEVRGAGGSLLDSREVYFLVPPEIIGPGGPGK